MDSFTIDTNVLIVANGKSEQATITQRANVIDFLTRLINTRQIISIDDLGHILEEYKGHLSFKGEPGVGDSFFKWIHNNLGSQICEHVPIQIDRNEHFEFAELHDIDSLKGFDKSDQKFVAVALKSKNECKICNAVDSDWDNYSQSFNDIGVEIINVAN